MKITNLDERIHVLDSNTDVWKVISEVAESGVQEEAFYICDIGEIVKKHEDWKKKLPRVDPHYAVKCNDSLTVLEVLAALGTGFDCASKVELSKVLKLGVDPTRIIFANPAKQASHIRYSSAVGVDTMTFDNETELHKVKSLFPSARLVIRIRCDAKVAQCPLGMKYGVSVKEAPHLLEVARELGLNVVGVSFHVGSGCGDPPVFRRAIAAARDLFEYGASLGYQFSLLDIGGGFPGNKGSNIDKIAEVINKSLDEYFPEGCGVHIIAEPGRYFAASAYTLATNIHTLREVPREDGSISYMYYINDGVYGSFNCLLYDHAHVTPIPLKPIRGKLHVSSIWGPTCDGLDQVAENILLPQMQVGDWIIFEDMGAYTLACAGTFNGFPVPKVHTVATEKVWLMLKDRLPFTEDHFVIGSTPADYLHALDLSGTRPWEIESRYSRVTSGSPMSTSSDEIEPHSNFIGPHPNAPFIFEYFEVSPVN